MTDIPANELVVVTTLLAATIAAIGYIWKSRDTQFRDEIDRLSKELDASRAKVDGLQDKLLAGTQAQIDTARIQTETYQRLAKSLEEQNLTLKAAVGMSKGTGA